MPLISSRGQIEDFASVELAARRYVVSCFDELLEIRTVAKSELPEAKTAIFLAVSAAREQLKK
jgi:hypothetical protein